MTHVTPAPIPSILLVDDDPDICRALTDLLEYEQYEVAAVGTGTEAMAKVKVRSFSAMILDLGLPDLDGLDLLKTIRQIDSTVPIIILTALTGEDRKTGCLEAGAYAFLTKPYDTHELKAILSRVVMET